MTGIAAKSSTWVNDYVGVPYLVNGRDRSGWDCWGLVVIAFREQRGIELPDWRVGTARNHLGELAEAVTAITRGVLTCVREGRAEQVAEPEPWAIVTVQRARRPNHVGLVVGRSVLHCAERTRGTICQPLHHFVMEHGEPSYWRWKGT